LTTLLKVVKFFWCLLTHHTHNHPQPLLGKEGSTHYRHRQDTLTKEGLGVVVLTVRKVSYSSNVLSIF